MTCQGSSAWRSSTSRAEHGEVAVLGEAEFEVRREPLAARAGSPPAFCSAITSARSCSMKYGSMKRSCSSVPQRASRAGSYGSRQKRAISERSRSCCVRLMRSCGGISKARISSRPSRPVLPSGENILSMQNSARCVLPVESMSRLRNRRSTSHGGGVCPARRQLLERELELVQRIVARLVDARRLRGGADEQPAEQIGQRRMVVPVRQQAAQQVRPAQERRIGRRGAAEHEVVAAAGAGVAAVEHELLGSQPATGARRRRGAWCGRPARPSCRTDGCSPR